MTDLQDNVLPPTPKARREASFAKLKHLADGNKYEMSIDRSVDLIRIRLHSDNLPGGIPFSYPLIIVTLEGKHEH